ncbi:gamma-aminobutyric acid receptor subunit beta-like isoform x2 [Dermatophagoides farinae]|nr:gamma-aminobutyric acid receptor subunit beta-like isoform x2 [Dermatophagoides farinae]
MTRAIVPISSVTLLLLLLLSSLKNLLLNKNHHTSLLLQIIIILILFMNFGAQAKNDKEISEHEPENKSDAYSDAGSNITKILNAFFDSGYDKRVRPEYGGPPVQVGVSMHIIGISSVSEVQMDFTSDFYFRQLWKDNRLAFTPVGEIDKLVVGAEVAQKIWVPDTFFANEKVASFHSATTPNTFLRISSSGEVYRSIRLTVTASCPMNLQYFPMDSQLCTIEIESYGYSMADIVYIWSKGKESIGMSKGLELPQFKVVGYRQSMKIETLSTGNYSRLVCEIQFERSMGYYLIQIYIPASLIVIISWVSFWLHRNATPARVALGVTTVLTMTTLMSSTNAALPKISYIKSIDVFLGTCFVMVFASLLEYATVGYLGKRIAMRKTRSQQLAKLAQEHRNRCAAAAAAAAAAATGTNTRSGSINLNMSGPGASVMSNQMNVSGQSHIDDDGNEPNELTIPPPMPMQTGHGMLCQPDLNSTLHRSVKPIPIHQTLDRLDRYATIGTPRIVHHPSMNCPPSCPQAYGRQDIRLNRATPILSGPECAARKSFSAKSSYSAHLPPDSPINGTPSLTISAPCTAMVPPPPPIPAASTGLLGPHCSQTSSSSPINLHKRHQHTNESTMGPEGDNASMSGQQQTGGQHFGPKNPNKLFGVSPSDIDKYSRVVFPVCFVCFNLMYWVIYLHISSQMIEDLIPAN